MSDVTATLALARALRLADEALFDELLSMRFKARVEALVDTNAMTPLVYVSGLMGTERACLGVIAPLAVHPEYKSHVICADLSREPDFLEMTPQEIQARLFAKGDELASPSDRPGLMTVQINKAPVLLPMQQISPDIAARLGLDGDSLRRNLATLRHAREDRGSEFIQHLQSVYQGGPKAADSNPDTALYGAFVPNSDRRLIQEVQESSPAELRDHRFAFTDRRLPELLFRYRARNWPDILTDAERATWREHCREQWQSSDHLNLEEFRLALAEEQVNPKLGDKQRAALADLERWVAENAKVLGVSGA
jgi:exodeoxyribonuclease-1